ncbi:MAG: phosphatase PAP2 family protein [Candidatus Cloacimonetes bacterium]|nr:phosphatase PAP2 family protein [Candidatus Cloacimonadota bacterium]
MKFFLAAVIAFLSLNNLPGQTFQINRFSYLLSMGLLAALDISNNYLDEKLLPEPSPSEIMALDSRNIPWFDRWISYRRNKSWKNVSDYCYYLTFGAGLYCSYEEDYFWDNLLVLSQILVAQSAVGKWIKTGSGRYRPYVYDDPAEGYSQNGRHSFYSLHSSGSFAIATFAYYCYSKNNGSNLPLALVLFGGALSTSITRIVSAQHFPSDILAGAVMGSGISWLICLSHRQNRLNVSCSAQSLDVSWYF